MAAGRQRRNREAIPAANFGSSEQLKIAPFSHPITIAMSCVGARVPFLSPLIDKALKPSAWNSCTGLVNSVDNVWAEVAGYHEPFRFLKIIGNPLDICDSDIPRMEKFKYIPWILSICLFYVPFGSLW